MKYTKISGMKRVNQGNYEYKAQNICFKWSVTARFTSKVINITRTYSVHLRLAGGSYPAITCTPDK